MLRTEFSTSITCSHFPLCGGCRLQRQVDTPPIWENVKKYFDSLEIPIELKWGPITKWRTRAKLAVRGSKNNPQIGLFQRDSHEVVNLSHCPHHDPRIDEMVAFIRSLMIRFSIPPYHEKNHSGVMRYLQLVVEKQTGLIQVSFVLRNLSNMNTMKELMEILWKSEKCHSIWVNIQDLPINRIFGLQWYLIHGNEDFWERVNEISLYVHPSCFFQAHLPLFEQLVNQVKNELEPNRHVIEYYAGVGVIGLSILDRCRSLSLVEANALSQSCFKKSLSPFMEEEKKKCTFHLGEVERFSTLCSQSEVAIFDPPRKGISEELLRQTMESQTLQQIFYVSCFFPSFQRDAEKILQAGWKIKTAQAYLFFPGSDHVEILAVFEKKSG